MLKILINNEEVVSDKNFTIKKEMLNTPSVILNNVYPKTWEEDKDYVSRFYHPNDYSKCKISDDTYHPEEPGITVEDTNFSIEVDTTKEYDFQSFKGQTTQNGTPTPSSPVPINVVSGRQDVQVCGKNLFDKSKATTGKIVNRTTGTLSTQVNYGVTDFIPVKAGKQYTFTGFNYWYTAVYDENKEYLSIVDNTATITIPNGAYYLRTSFQLTNIDTAQFEKGNQKTSYEAYTGNTYEINLGKNLLKVVPATSSDAQKGIITTYEDTTGKISFSGTTTNTYPWLSDATIPVNIPTGTSLVLSTPTPKTYQIIVRLYASDNTQEAITISANATSGTKTTTKNITRLAILLNLASGVPINDELYLQLEKGSQATSYTPYKTPIELCKIGTYQDKIFHNIPSNPYYDSTLNEGAWYIYKQIGKIVLNGSETYQKLSNGRFRAVISPNFAEYGYGTRTQCYSNRFSCYAIYESYGYGECYCWADKIYFGIDETNTTTSQAGAWCSTNKPVFYGVLATPTYTEIEDSELISQLESIELLNGLNNIGISTPYLPFIMTLLYNHVDEWTESDLLFCGVVKNSGNISLNPREPHYQTLQILDFKTFLSEGETLDFVIYQKTISEAIEQVVSSISEYGFIVGEIKLLNPDEIIGAYSTKDKSAYDVLNYIADITQSRWTTRMIDENTVAIDFYDPTLMEQGTSINYTQEWFSQYKIDNMYYSYGSNDYRNKQVMTSNNVYSNITQTQTIVANGYQTQFNTELPIGKIESIKINDVEYSFSTNQEKEMGYIADFYYTPGNNYFESANNITVGTSIVISYVSIVEGRQVITNPTEIDRVNNATGRKGVVARYETRNDAITSNELQLIGQSYIKYKGIPEVILTVQTRSNIWEVGQRVPFNAPIQELTGEYMVRSKTINRVLANPSTEDIIFYTYEMTSSFNSETAINYFDNQRAKANGNIGEGEYISRNIDIESVANIIFYDTEATEIAIVGDNILEAILEAPFVE